MQIFLPYRYRITNGSLAAGDDKNNLWRGQNAVILAHFRDGLLTTAIQTARNLTTGDRQTDLLLSIGGAAGIT